MGALVAFVLFHVGWWSCILGAARGYPWAGPAVVGALAAAHVAVTPRAARAREIAVVVATLAIGIAVDTAQTAAGVMRFATNPLAPLPPLFMIALWGNFSLHLTGLLRPLGKWPVVAVVLGAIGGPLAYGGGEAMGALRLHENPILGLGSIAVSWGVLMPILLAMSRRLRDGAQARDLSR